VAVPFETAHALARLSADVLGEADLPASLERVCRVASDVVERCDGCSVTLRADGSQVASAGDGPWATDLDALQSVEQEGPCLDCLRTSSLVRVRDLARDSRFPSYGPRAAQRDAHSVVSVPLSGDGRTAGALNLYSRRPDAFDTDDVALASLLAAHASLALQAAIAFRSSRDLAAQLQAAMESRAVIEQAKGVVMERTRCSADAAFTALVTRSQSANRKLRDVAWELVDEVSGAPADRG
jgi:GAF domain-containing protein